MTDTKKSNSKTTSKKEIKPQLKNPKILFKQTQKHILALEKIFKAPVLTYFKPSSGSIWTEDLYAILECLKSISQVDKLVLFVRSNGGSGMISLRIVHLLRSFAKELIILAPSECASAATMLALGCDHIYMGPVSSLSPVDSSLTHSLSPLDNHKKAVSVSMDELLRVVKLWQNSDQKALENFEKIKQEISNNLKNSEDLKTLDNIKYIQENPYKYLYQYIHPLVFGSIDRHSSLSVRICNEVLGYHIKDKQHIEKITQALNYGYPAHGYPITSKQAKELGLPIKELTAKMQKELSELQLLYGEMTADMITDYNETSYHDNSIMSVIETRDCQVYYKCDYDKFYRNEQKSYITLNLNSAWYKVGQSTSKNKSKTDDLNISKLFF